MTVLYKHSSPPPSEDDGIRRGQLNEEIIIYIPSDIVQVKEFLTKLGFKNPDEYKSIAHEKSIIVSDSIYCIYFCHKDNKTEKILDKNNKPIDAIMDDKLYLFGSNLSAYIETSNNADLVVVLIYEKNKRVIEDRYVLHKTFKYTLACSTIL